MKKWIIPICMACMMLVPMCKRDTGGIHGVIDSKKDFEYGKNSKKQHQPFGYTESSSEDTSDKKKTVRRSVIFNRTVRENGSEKTNIKSSKEVGNMQSNASVLSNTHDSKRKDANKERKPGGLLIKPRVDVPDVK